jgi:hypothetical protein
MTVILGANGTGKSTLLNEILTKSGQRALVVTPYDVEWLQYPANELKTPADFQFTGIQRHIFNPYADSLARTGCFSNGALVFDDCRNYFNAATDNTIHALLIARRQRMLDVFAAGHGFTEVPPVFFTFSTDIILFRTADRIDRRKDCLRNFDLMCAAQERINQKARTNPYYYEHLKIS